MDQETLRELAEQKEKEWRVIQEKRIEALESSLRQKTNELVDEKQKFKQLKEDFKYNLKLLDERDKELDKFEQSLVATRKQLADKNAEISELKIKLDDLKKLQDNEKDMLDECKKYYLNRLNQKQNEIEKYKAEKDKEINQERNEIEKFKRTLQRQIQDLQFDLDKQRNELKTEFDNIIRKREHEWRMQADELNTFTLAKDLEIKMLNNELNQLREANNNIITNTNDYENSFKNLEKKLKEKEWELKDTIALKDSKIKELESKCQQNSINLKHLSEDLNRKLDETDRALREKELCLKNLKNTLNEEEKTRLFLEQQIDEYKKQIKHLNETITKLENGNKMNYDYLNEDINKLKCDLTKEIELKAKQIVNADLSIDELNKEKNKLKSILESCYHEIQILSKKLAECENEKSNLIIDWQRKYSSLEKLKSRDSEEFTRKILESKDECLDRIKQLEEKLEHKENVIKALQSADPSLKTIDFDSNDLFKLKEENERLKSIIKQMRLEMENIASGDNTNKKIEQPKQPTLLSDVSNNEKFDEDLKRQLLESKQKNRQLQSQIDEFMLKQKLPENISDNALINNHIKSLNETINQLRKEKVDLTAHCKKQQTREIHIEKKLTDLNEQLRLKQTQLETLQYEMSSQTRRSNTEVSNLKQMLANIEIELSSTRKEADEYHKATIEKNSEISSLETKIGELKLKLSLSGTQINFGAQELFIQQLQDEIKRVNNLNKQLQIKARQQHHELLREVQNTTRPSSNKNSNNLSQDTLTSKNEIDSLRSKLKTAAKFITQLVNEKEHLIEMSNELRGQLNRIKFENESLYLLRINRDIAEQDVVQQERTSRPSSSPHINQTAKTFSNNQKTKSKSPLATKLEQLEQKQYELTKKQLAFAQRYSTKNNNSKTKSEPALYGSYKSSNYNEDMMTTPSSAASIDESNTVTSSVRSENLRDIWKLLDEKEDENNGLLNNMDPIMDSALKVTSIKPEKSTTRTSKSPRVITSSKSTTNKPKIRNYNIKD